jgi:hypothetical protein
VFNELQGELQFVVAQNSTLFVARKHAIFCGKITHAFEPSKA